MQTIVLTTVLIVAAVAAAAHLVYRRDMQMARETYEAVAAAVHDGTAGTFDPVLISDLPEPARRYLAWSIEPGTPLRTTVELDMRGTFALGDKDSHRLMPMRARQVLSPGRGFVWMPEIGTWPMRMSGSDGFHAGTGWTRFWLLGLVPLVRVADTPDLARSAAARSVMEAIWAPASLLPQTGARWEATGPDSAKVTLDTAAGPLTMALTLGPEGRLLAVEMSRWSDANPAKVFRHQPFGGTMEEVGTFSGYTVPTRVVVGNHFGTGDYFPFFRAEILNARYR